MGIHCNLSVVNENRDVLIRQNFVTQHGLSSRIVNKAEWLGSPANIKGANKDAII